MARSVDVPTFFKKTNRNVSSFPLTNALLKGACIALNSGHGGRAGEISRLGRELGGVERDFSKWEDKECLLEKSPVESPC